MSYPTLNSETSINKLKKALFRVWCRMCERIEDHRYRMHTRGGLEDSELPDGRIVSPIMVSLMCAECETHDNFVFSTEGLMSKLSA